MQCLFLKVVGEAFFSFYSQWRLQGHRPMEGIVPTILWGDHRVLSWVRIRVMGRVYLIENFRKGFVDFVVDKPEGVSIGIDYPYGGIPLSEIVISDA